MASLGGYANAAQPHWDQNDPMSYLAGACKRIMDRRVRPTKRLYKAMRRKAEEWVKQFPQLPATTEISFEHWLEESNYPAWRKEQIKEAWNDENPSSKMLENIVGSFIKDEQKSKFTHCRTINARNDFFKALLGPYVHEAEKCMFSNTSFVKRDPVAKRFAKLARALDTPGQAVSATDHETYEIVFCADFVEAVTMPVYEHIFAKVNASKFFTNYRRYVIPASGHKIKSKWFVFEGVQTECSGEMDTSFKNGEGNKFGAELANELTRTFVNSIAGNLSEMILLTMLEDTVFPELVMAQDIPHTCMPKPGCNFESIELAGLDHRGVYEGDDGITTSSVATSATLHAKLGFKVKREFAPTLEGLDFCSVEGSLRTLETVTDPRVIISRMPFLSSAYVDARRGRKLELYRARALSCLSMYPSAPIVSEYCEYILRMTKHVCMSNFGEQARVGKWRMDQYLEAISNAEAIRQAIREPSDYARFVVESRYGINVLDQIVIESHIRQMTKLAPLECPTLDMYMPDAWRAYFWRYATYDDRGFEPCVPVLYDNFPSSLKKDLAIAGFDLWG